MSYIPKKKRVNKPWGNNHDQKIYKSVRWKRERLDYLEENPYCVECRRRGKRRLATVVDHIRPIRFGGEFWDWDNWMSLCREHHNSKSAIESNCKNYIEWRIKIGGR